MDTVTGGDCYLIGSWDDTGKTFKGTVEDSGYIAPGQKVTPGFGVRGGPVEVQTWTDEFKTETAISIASQRSVWGPSFGDTAGYIPTRGLQTITIGPGTTRRWPACRTGC